VVNVDPAEKTAETRGHHDPCSRRLHQALAEQCGEQERREVVDLKCAFVAVFCDDPGGAETAGVQRQDVDPRELREQFVGQPPHFGEACGVGPEALRTDRGRDGGDLFPGAVDGDDRGTAGHQFPSRCRPDRPCGSRQYHRLAIKTAESV
jgi:hypothetical protein